MKRGERMMKRKKASTKRKADYEDQNAWPTMIAAMIFAQAKDDAIFLGERETKYTVSHEMLNRFEIVNFLRSDWGKMLAAYINVTQKELNWLESFVLGGGC
jgi:hypothetical protein